MTGLIIILILGAAAIAAIIAGPALHRRRRDRIVNREFPPSWSAILTRTMPAYRSVPAPLRVKLQAAIRIFLAEKRFIGCNGLAVTEEMQVSIAGQACLLIAELGIERYDHVRSVLLYPDAFIAGHEHRDEAGVHTIAEKELGGESWPDGKVVLSWKDVREGWAQGEEAYNVVYHEFAHQLDQADGDADGAPILDDRTRYRRWAEVFEREYARLLRAIERGEETLLTEDAAESPGEFFAVVTEIFMDSPHALRAHHPEIYAELRDYLRLDPASWSA